MLSKWFPEFNYANFSSNNSAFNNFFSILSALNTYSNIIIIVKDNNMALELVHLANLLNESNQNNKDTKKIHYFPSLLSTPYQKIPPNRSVLNQRMLVLSALLKNPENNLLITTATGFLSKLIPKDYLTTNKLILAKGQTITIAAIQNFLISNNYQNVSTVYQAGSFAVRGDIIDIATLDNEDNIKAIRIDIFDNSIERIRVFDAETQKTVNTIETIEFYPNNEIIINRDILENFKSNYFNEFKHHDNELIQLLEQNIKPIGIENLANLFFNSSSVLADYLSQCRIINFLGKKGLSDNITLHNNAFLNIQKQLDSFNKQENILPPHYILLTEEDLNNLYNNLKVLEISDNSENSFKVLNFNLQFAEYKNRYETNITAITQYINDNLNKKIIIFTQSNQFHEDLTNSLVSNNITFKNEIDDSNLINIVPVQFNLSANYIFNNLIVINEYNITGLSKTWVDNNYVKRNSSYKKIMQQLSTIGTGDIVVHKKHGLAKYLGIKTLKANDIDHDFLELEYRNIEKLFVPVENIDLISLYTSSQASDAILDKLGSGQFEIRQNKVKEQIKDIAYDLVQISANRELQKGLDLEINYHQYNKFVDKFPYVDTEDQKNAINDIINDIEANKPIDRLICGDVGFGKTEIAMRTCFLVTSANFQSIVIAPTTILVEQHYNSFVERFQGFNINIAKLSRFSSIKQKKEVLEGLASGSINIVIGTHSLLSSKIKYKNLGLVVIDEEQSFGVLQKELLKSFKNNVNILTLSATPIPRTLQLSLKGLKDLSLITTPPSEKLPINTYVIPLDYITIKNAIVNEKERGGQIFFVCPKIKDIEYLDEVIEKLNLGLRKIHLHGQMSKDDIENNMIAFTNHEFDLLLCTNIIESGLNLKNVNTIIIYNSNQFGLSQLYQLRGRVGRGHIQGNAYLIYDDLNSSEKSRKRLEIMQSLDYLGASFTLASYDLDIRGSGNLLGEQQSGHIKEIGFDLYQKLLQQEITNLRSKNNNNKDLDLINFSPSVKLNVSVLLPKSYISNIEVSMEIYQRLGNVSSLIELTDIKDELVDRFGVLPTSAQNLLTTIEIKIKSKELHIEKIIASNKGISMYFYNNYCPYAEKLFKYIANPLHNLSIKAPSILFLEVSNNLNIAPDTTEEHYSAKQIRHLMECLHNLKALSV